MFIIFEGVAESGFSTLILGRLCENDRTSKLKFVVYPAHREAIEHETSKKVHIVVNHFAYIFLGRWYR